MLTACATSQAKIDPQPAPDPVVEIRVERIVVCSPEVTADLPEAPKVPEGAIIDGNGDGIAYVGNLGVYADLLRQRLIDAHAACPS